MKLKEKMRILNKTKKISFKIVERKISMKKMSMKLMRSIKKKEIM
jgi:hypothetical protein